MNILLYNYPLSPCGEKVRLALAEKGLAHEVRNVDLGAKENLTAEFLTLSPQGYVPVLVVDGATFIESTVINELIDEISPQPPLKPTAFGDRARMRLWTKLVDEVLHPAWPGIAWPILVRPAWQAKPSGMVEDMLAKLLDPARRDRQRRMYREGVDAPGAIESVAIFTDVCDQMEECLRRTPWLAGDAYSLADIALLPYCFAIDAFGMRALFENGRPALADWYRRCDARPAYGDGIRSMFDPARLSEVECLGREAWVSIVRRLRT